MGLYKDDRPGGASEDLDGRSRGGRLDSRVHHFDYVAAEVLDRLEVHGHDRLVLENQALGLVLVERLPFRGAVVR